MKVIDSTKSVSKYLADNCEDIRQDNDCGVGGWCRFMSVIDGKETYKTWLLNREKTVDRVVATFEIWNEKTIAISKENWSVIFPKIRRAVEDFEVETGQTINIERVSGPTKWADY